LPTAKGGSDFARFARVGVESVDRADEAGVGEGIHRSPRSSDSNSVVVVASTVSP
jgi:hypothetical protein